MIVHWTAAALCDLRSIHATISRTSQRYAESMVSRIFDRSDILQRHPYFGAVVPEYGIEDLRELFEHPYRIVYKVLSDQIDVIAVVHAARQMPPNLA